MGVLFFLVGVARDEVRVWEGQHRKSGLLHVHGRGAGLLPAATASVLPPQGPSRPGAKSRLWTAWECPGVSWNVLGCFGIDWNRLKCPGID